MRPNKRLQDLVVQELPGETLVYDLRTHRAVALNESLTMVWRNCDGSQTVEEIAASLSDHFGTEVPRETVLFALEELNREELLQRSSTAEYLPGISRRDAIRRIGQMTAVAIPIIASITAPLAAQAQSTCIPGGSCTCNARSSGRVGLQCTPSVPCANAACRCVWRDNGNNQGTCVV